MTDVYLINHFMSMTGSLFNAESVIRVLIVAACAVGAFVVTAYRD